MVIVVPLVGDPVAADPISSDVKESDTCWPGLMVKLLPGESISGIVATVMAAHVPPAEATNPVMVGAGVAPVEVPANWIWQLVVVQDITEEPTFLIVRENAPRVVAVELPLIAAWTT